MERHRRGGLQEQAFATQSGGHHTSCDPARPWDWVRREAIKDAMFWRRELEEPCLLILSKITSTQNFVYGDANIQPINGLGSQQQNRGQKRNIDEERAHKALYNKAHNVKDGLYETNRRGAALCPGWQNGTCTETLLNGFHYCKRDGSLTHQCSKCLSPDHGADKCNNSKRPKASAAPPPGKGGGKFKKGGGKGKR